MQSIYGFRGAAPGVFRLYREVYERFNAGLVCALEANYRWACCRAQAKCCFCSRPNCYISEWFAKKDC